MLVKGATGVKIWVTAAHFKDSILVNIYMKDYYEWSYIYIYIYIYMYQHVRQLHFTVGCNYVVFNIAIRNDDKLQDITFHWMYAYNRRVHCDSSHHYMNTANFSIQTMIGHVSLQRSCRWPSARLVAPLLTHWSYCDLAPSHRCSFVWNRRNMHGDSHSPYHGYAMRGALVNSAYLPINCKSKVSVVCLVTTVLCVYFMKKLIVLVKPIVKRAEGAVEQAHRCC